MGFRCLLGHDFGPAEVEREREEDGNEMVVTIRQVKTCERCGAERVMTENKEVTSIRTPEAVGLDDEGDGTADPGGDGAGEADGQADDEGFQPPTDAEEDDGVILGDDERAPGEWPAPDRELRRGGSAEPADRSAADVPATSDGAGANADATGDEGTPGTGAPDADGADAAGVEAVDDDAEIIDGDGGDGGTIPWPDREAPAAAAPAGGGSDAAGGSDTGWPDHAAEDEGYDAEAATGGGPGVPFDGGLTPQANRGGDAADPDADDGDTVGDDGSAPAGDPAGPDGDGDAGRTGRFAPSDGVADVEHRASTVDVEFHCSNCGYASAATGSSLRAGDICPDCRTGYLREREH